LSDFKAIFLQMKYILFLIILMPLLSALGYAEEDDAQKYEKCMGLVETSAQGAVDYANDWIFSGFGGIPAGHCKALGLLGIGQAKDAAKLLDSLGDEMVVKAPLDPSQATKNAQIRTQLFVQAALAWQRAEAYDKAYISYSSALSGITDDDPHNNRLIGDLYMARGHLQILRGENRAAINDFTSAIEKNSRSFEGFLARAKAYRKIRQYLKARLDVKEALILSPDHPEVLLEKGILLRLEGKKLEARAAWQKIIDLYPQSDDAEIAHENIDLLQEN